MLEKIRQHIAENQLMRAGSRVLVGVSGGVDSISLASVLHELGYRIRVAHVNYGMRGKESDLDEALVERFCAERSLPFFSLRETPPGTGSIQKKARDIRYRFFEEVAQQEGVDLVAVAHNKNDQAETVLLNLMRGGGFDGLAGMRAHRPIRNGSAVRLVRPLLGVARPEIEAYTRAHHLSWREDASNQNLGHARSRIRTKVLPALDDCDTGSAIEELVAVANEMRFLVDHVLPSTLPATLLSVLQESGEQLMPLEELKSLDTAVRAWYLLRVIRQELPGAPLRRTTVRRVVQLIDAPVGKKLEFSSGSIWRERGHLRIQDGTPEPIHGHDSTVNRSSISGSFGTISWEDVAADGHSQQTHPSVIRVDRDKIEGPLSVRPWQPGDIFQPFGMAGRKKIKSFLTDQRVSPSQKKNVHVLCDNGKIVWVIGHRMDDAYRVHKNTSVVRQFSFSGQDAFPEAIPEAIPEAMPDASPDAIPDAILQAMDRIE